ncbi:hypothetical protein ElyMa_004091000 [Elysia marginata]|uniref:Uncharacterized protein n=1 Tax=Elysia marginata TaxID=1093978 RepID=A0AAV4GAZ3_9GAST|nr:hypothetical protein ElyMa_004091000 [Elysia marginata]
MAERYQHCHKHQNIPQQRAQILRHSVAAECLGDDADLVSCDDVDERSDDDVENWVAWNQDQHAMSVGRHPDVILADKQLQKGDNVKDFS